MAEGFTWCLVIRGGPLDHRQKLSQGECSAFPSKELCDAEFLLRKGMQLFSVGVGQHISGGQAGWLAHGCV